MRIIQLKICLREPVQPAEREYAAPTAIPDPGYTGVGKGAFENKTAFSGRFFASRDSFSQSAVRLKEKGCAALTPKKLN